jgi:hypothetical protein
MARPKCRSCRRITGLPAFRASKFRAASAALTAVEPTATTPDARMAALIDMVLNNLTTALTKLAGTPEAIHPRRDHRAARAMFLDIGRGAVAHRVRSRIVAGIHPIGGLALVARIDPHAAGASAGRRGRIDRRRRRGLRDPGSGRRGLCRSSRSRQQESACKGDPYSRRPDPRHKPTQHVMALVVRF